jgi:hypothetical protein
MKTTSGKANYAVIPFKAIPYFSFNTLSMLDLTPGAGKET